jgi:polyferredoxin
MIKKIVPLAYVFAFAALVDYQFMQHAIMPLLVLVMVAIGFVFQCYSTYHRAPSGLQYHGTFFHGMSSRKWPAWILTMALTGFYVLIYWYPAYLGLGESGAPNTGLVHFFDPISLFLNGHPATQWFAYGTLYTYLIVLFGIRFLWKYKGLVYHRNRTITLLISQCLLAYFLPEILEGFSTEQAYFDKDIKNIWPLNYDFFYSWHLDNMCQSSMGIFFFVVGLFLFLIGTPILTYYFGKRWYCSWVCGCGGLAETTGDSFRQNGPKGLMAWRIERWSIYTVLILVSIMTAATLYGYFSGTDQLFGLSIYAHFQKPYGFVIGALFSGIAGVGFYPLLGTRIWCRFGCPMAAYMGIIQRFKSRFRITTNGGQCISCGNCTTYCEMGIDVRHYAQQQQNIVRASCVGCGVCASVCPRGVLKLENGPLEGRIAEPQSLVDYIQQRR